MSETPAENTPTETPESTPIYDQTARDDGENPTLANPQATQEQVNSAETAVPATTDYAKPLDGNPTDEKSTDNTGLDLENFTKDSPYDNSGMPIGTTYADYDNFADVAQKMVATRPVTHPPVAEPFEEEKLDTDPGLTKEGWNGALVHNVNSRFPLESDQKDLSDTGESRKLVQQENEDGTTTILDTPKLLNQGDLNEEKAKLDPKVIEEALQVVEAPIPDTPTPVEPAPVDNTSAPAENPDPNHDPENPNPPIENSPVETTDNNAQQ